MEAMDFTLGDYIAGVAAFAVNTRAMWPLVVATVQSECMFTQRA